MSAGAAVAVQPATTATGAADTPRAAFAELAATGPALPAGAAGPSAAPQSAGAAGTAGPADTTGVAGHPDPAIAAGPAVAPQPAAGPAGTTGRAGATQPAGPAVADQPGRPACTAGLTGGAGPAVAAVAVEDPAGPAGLPGPRRPVGAVADQRAPQQRHGRRIDRSQQLLLDVGGLGAGIRACRAREGLHELLVKRRRLGAQRLIGLGMAAKQRRHRGGHLIGASGQHTRRGGRGRSIGRADRRTDACQIRRRRAQHFRLCKQKRHDRPPDPVGMSRLVVIVQHKRR